MAATAFPSLWISNTASAMVMAPIAASIASAQTDRPRFATALMLGVAFAASIGGMGSLIGAPPNAILAAHVATRYGIDIGFAEWAVVGLPVATVLLVLAWVVLARLTPGVGRNAPTLAVAVVPEAAGSAERRVAMVAGLTALAWIAQPLLDLLLPSLLLSEAGIAMVAAIARFVVPNGRGGRLLGPVVLG